MRGKRIDAERPLLHHHFAVGQLLDAEEFAGEPVATIRLPVQVPFGFHGGWAPDKVTMLE